MATVAPHHQPPRTFRHEALLYAGRDDFVERTLPFIEQGIAAGDATLVAVPGPNLRLLRGALGAGHGVEFLDMTAVGRNPGSIISVWSDFLARHQADGRAARGIGEPVWAARTAIEIEECMIHEALIHTAFAAGPAWQLVCPYDTASLPPEVLARARGCHPEVWDADGHRMTPDFRPLGPAELLTMPIDAVAADATEVRFDAASLRELRAFVTRVAVDHGLARRVEALVLAVNELASNSVGHGDGEGLLRLWFEDHDLVCEVRDRGRIDDPLIGRRPPGVDQEGGRGVWLVHQVCDLVQLRSSPTGTVVRVRVRAPLRI